MLSRRVAAVVLPDLVTELAAEALSVSRGVRAAPRASPSRAAGAFASVTAEGAVRPAPRASPPPLAVVLVDGAKGAEPVKPTSLLDAVSRDARRFGVLPGQSLAEARALLSRLVVVEVSRGELRAALGRVAETALAFGATVSLEPPDTVWVDVTGAEHLFGGEDALAQELASRVRALGHVVRVAIAPGPRIAQALARWSDRPGDVVRVEPEEARRAVAALPITALPLEPDQVAWLARLGVLRLGQLAQIPRALAASRLGEHAGCALDLAEGRDDTPLVAHRLPSLLVERSEWDEPVTGIEPLLFVLRGLCARVSARLGGRGEAAQKLALIVEHDPAIARHEAVAAERELVFDLASPLWRAEEMYRVIAARLERTRLEAPSVALRLEAPAIIRALGRQLDLSRVENGVTGQRGLESLPVLVTELCADIGHERVGVLELADAHRPERQAILVPALAGSEPPRARKVRREPLPVRRVRSRSAARHGTPTRLLPQPVPIDGALRVGATLRLDHRLYTIEHIAFVERLEAVEWWTGAPVARDYLRLWLAGREGGLDALVYVERESGQRFLQAIVD